MEINQNVELISTEKVESVHLQNYLLLCLES